MNEPNRNKLKSLLSDLPIEGEHRQRISESLHILKDADVKLAISHFERALTSYDALLKIRNLAATDVTPTPNDCDLPRIRAQFATFNDAIDYAARSRKGLNFHDMRGELARVYSYADMREDALCPSSEHLAQVAA